MLEHQTGLDERNTSQEPLPRAGWRNALMAAGFFCFLAALLVGASMKEAAGAAPKLLALVAIALIAVSAFASLLNRMFHKESHAEPPKP